MVKAKNKANILESVKENKDQTRQSCQTWNKQIKSLGVGEQQERLLANC